MAYENILVETRGRVGLITLNRPKALNALNTGADGGSGPTALDGFEADAGIGCGGDHRLGEGLRRRRPDIKEMQAAHLPLDLPRRFHHAVGTGSGAPASR